MKKTTFVPISVLLGAFLLALVAVMTLFVAEHNPVYAQEVVTANTDFSLSNLTLSVGELNVPFAAATRAYTARVSNGTARIRVVATPNISGAQVSIKYGPTGTFQEGTSSLITGGTSATGGSVPLTVGNTTPTEIGIEVKALGYDAGDTDADNLVSVYKVTVTRIDVGASTNADLMNLGIVGQGASGAANVTTAPPLSPLVFESDVTRYTARVSNTTSTLLVTPAVDQATGGTFVIMPGSLTIAGNVPLTAGSNVITVKVTAADLATTKTYTLTVTRAAANASDDARLRSLSLSGITLSPDFDMNKSPETNGANDGIILYTANVPYQMTRTTVAHAVNQRGAKATIESPEDFNPLVAGHQVVLGVGSNTIDLMVSAEKCVDYKDVQSHGHPCYGRRI